MTNRTTHARKGAAAAPQIDPTAINPLIVTGPGELTDTINHVDAVLTFMSSAFLHAEQSGEGMNLSDTACWGASIVIDTCRAALAYVGQEGGAA